MAVEFGPQVIAAVIVLIEEAVAERKRLLALQTLREITLAIPVDTGRARASFTAQTSDIAIDVPVNPVNARRIPVPTPFIPTPADIKDPLYITSAVDYVVYLNEGTLYTDPLKFIESSLTKAVRKVK